MEIGANPRENPSEKQVKIYDQYGGPKRNAENKK